MVEPEGQLESPNEKSEISELKECIQNSPEAIEEEFARTENDWLSCFSSRIISVETWLQNKEIERVLAEKNDEVKLKLEALKDQVLVLRREYFTKDKQVPQDTKQELLDQLSGLLEE